MVVVLAAVVPLYNISAVAVLDYYRSSSPRLRDVAIDVLKTPLVDAALLAFVTLALGIQLPPLIASSLNEISDATIPLGFVVLGASLSVGGLRRHAVRLAVVSVVRLLLLPALSLSIAALLGCRGVELLGVLSVAGTPTALASFATAQTLGADGELAALLVTVTSALSVLTLGIWVFVLNSTGML
jgi:predicted permease